MTVSSRIAIFVVLSTMLKSVCPQCAAPPIPYFTETGEKVTSSASQWLKVIPSRQECGGAFINEAEGEILSPNYPDEYPPNTNCSWAIYGEFNKRIHLSFQEFELDWNQDCEVEHLEIQDCDGNTLHCGGGLPPDITSQLNFLVIIFRSDDKVAGEEATRNFKLKFTLVDADPVGVCQSFLPDNPCSNNGTCVDDSNNEEGYVCDCTSDFTGPHCDCPVDPCGSVDCGEGGVCIETSDCTVTACICLPGFVDFNGVCVDVNECTQFDPCHPDATCENTPGSFTCTCNEGFEGNGVDSCEPVSTDGCPDDWSTYEGSSSCYYAYAHVQSGTESYPKCIDLRVDAVPVCIDSQEEMNFVSTFSSNARTGLMSAATWLGIGKSSDGSLFCFNGGTPMTPSPWFPGQPNGEGSCVYTRPSKMATKYCDPSLNSEHERFFGLCETTPLCEDRAVCPPLFHRAGDSCYFALPAPTGFDVARNVCRELDTEADLAVFEDQAELSAAMQAGVISSGGPYWAGLRFDEGQGQFSWIDGTPLTYDPWMPQEPQLPGDSGAAGSICGVIGKTGWADSRCEVEYIVVCEFDNSGGE